ncbi:MAG: DUF1887 family protein [Lachnospira sp.]|nr:DUF1887 family protein [Lachnospira sp.]
MIQIDFFGADVTSMLVPIHSTKPDKVYFLVDPAYHTMHDVKLIQSAIMEWKIVKEVELVKVDSGDIEDINRRLDEIVGKHEEKIYIDLTGGHELMIACGYSVCKKADVVPIYADIRKGVVYDVNSKNVLCKVDHIGLSDYLNAVGAKQLNGSHSTPKDDLKDSVLNMGRVIFADLNRWHALHSYLTANVKPDLDTVRIPKNIMYHSKRYDVSKLIDAFCENGFAVLVGKNLYRFADAASKEYMITFGIWLEMFVYFKVKEYYDETCLGAIIDWNESDYIDTEDNEIDVMAIKDSVPVFISCKMKKIVASEVYEVGFLADRLGGSSAKAIMATTFPVRTEGDGVKGIYQRLKKMRVGFVEVTDLDRKGVESVMDAALKLAE